MKTITPEKADRYIPGGSFNRTLTAFVEEPFGWSMFGNEQLRGVLGCLPNEGGVYVAGGCLTDLVLRSEPKDIDLFLTDDDVLSELDYRLTHGGGYTRKGPYMDPSRVIEYVSSYPDRVPVQVIGYFVYDDVQHLLDGFDFTATQMATDGRTVYYGPQTLDDLENKRLRLHRLNSVEGVTLKHALRYMHKGYQPLPETVEALCTKTFAVKR